MALIRAHSEGEWVARLGEERKPSALAIGNFDGLHIGHQKILRRALERARGENLLAAVLTFYPHPTRVLRPAEASPLLMTLPQRLAGIEGAGMDAALVVHFDAEFALVSPEEFVSHFLVETMRARAVVVGANFRFGHRQSGDAQLLAELGRRTGVSVELMQPVTANGAVVSSTAIRQALRAGNVEEAARMLGRPFALAGGIRAGTGLGGKLVVPTLNLWTEQELLPANGVYATEAALGTKTYRAATNVGLRPTFDGAQVTIESHLLDFSERLTEGNLEVRFLARLREERKFSSPEALRRQVLADIEEARHFFTAHRP